MQDERSSAASVDSRVHAPAAPSAAASKLRLQPRPDLPDDVYARVEQAQRSRQYRWLYPAAVPRPIDSIGPAPWDRAFHENLPDPEGAERPSARCLGFA